MDMFISGDFNQKLQHMNTLADKLQLHVHQPEDESVHSVTKHYSTHSTHSLVDYIVSSQAHHTSVHVQPPSKTLLDHLAIRSHMLVKPFSKQASKPLTKYMLK